MKLLSKKIKKIRKTRKTLVKQIIRAVMKKTIILINILINSKKASVVNS